jgi:hypothetical protein
MRWREAVAKTHDGEDVGRLEPLRRGSALRVVLLTAYKPTRVAMAAR